MWRFRNTYGPGSFLSISSVSPAGGYRPRRSTVPHFVRMVASWLHNGDRVFFKEGRVRQARPCALAFSVRESTGNRMIDARTRRYSSHLDVGGRGMVCCTVPLEYATTEDRLRLGSRFVELLLGRTGSQNTEHTNWASRSRWRRRVKRR